MKFTDFEFNENILKGIEDAGFKECHGCTVPDL